MMKKFYQLLLTPILSICLVGSLVAQVSFTNMGGNLGSINGNSYEDCAVDMNGDFLDDVVRVTNTGLYIDYQQPDGSFTQALMPMSFQTYPSWSICAGDIDGNGFNDLLFGGGSNVSFIYANADGTAYTEDYHSEYIFSQRSTFADIDNDGHLDAFVCHDVDQSHPYRNDGAGNLVEDQNIIQTIPLAGNYSAIWVDYDNDWDTDLYITKCRLGSTPGDIERTNAMYRNNGDGTYTEVGTQIGLDDNAQSWTTVFQDFDNDGDFDAFIVNHDGQNRFMENDGNGNYTEIISSTGINPNDLGAWEAAGADFNNDGFIDILSELGNELYINNGDMTFTGQSLPFDDGGIGDFNNDGFLDVIRGNSLYVNDGNDNNWVKINTQGIVSNKNGIGARVEIHGDWGVQVREVRAGESFSPMSTLTVHFGLGSATSIDNIIIKWPSGVQTTIPNPAINTTHNIPEADCILASSTIETTGGTSFCAGGSVTLTGPSGFNSYTWSNGASGQSIVVTEPGSYSVVSADGNDCLSLSNSVLVTVVEEDVAPIVSVEGADKFCYGGSTILTTGSDSNPVWSNNESGQSITVTESGTYFVQTDALCSDDPLVSEAVFIDVITPIEPVTEDAFLTEPGPAQLTATGDNLFWFDSPTGGNEIGTGNSYDIAQVDSDITVWVESRITEGGELQDGGKLDNSGDGGLPSTGAYNYFTTTEPFTLLQVTVYVPDNAPSGIRDIQLVDENDNVIEEISFDLDQGQHTLDLNFSIPVGNNLTLRCPQNNLFRNSSGINYPYPIGDVGQITTSFYGDNWYYYFYDWKIQKQSFDCISDRSEATAYLFSVSNEEIEGTLNNLKIFPNPTSSNANITFNGLENTEVSIQLFDMTGRAVNAMKVIQTFVGEQTTSINLTDVPKGMYNVRLTANGKSVNRKLVVQ